jgi:hypothetical protein
MTIATAMTLTQIKAERLRADVFASIVETAGYPDQPLQAVL